MAGWYKHDISAWMDATEGLDHESYRVYHVICQLIYLQEGPIKRHDAGIAGRCNMHKIACRNRIDQLIAEGKLTANSDGTLGQHRAYSEILRMGMNRVHAGFGGNARANSLKNKTLNEATLQEAPAQRLEETREEETRIPPAPRGGAPIKRSKKTLMPENFTLTPERKSGAERAGCPSVEAIFREFKLEAETKQSLSASWDASWVIFYEKRARWAKERRAERADPATAPTIFVHEGEDGMPRYSTKKRTVTYGDDGMPRYDS